jgi:cytochrome P450
MCALAETGAILRIRLGALRAFVINDPEVLRVVLREDAIFDKGGILIDELARYAGQGLVTCPHSGHRQVRRIVQPGFREPAFGRNIELVRAETLELSRSWASGQIVDMAEFSRRVFSRAIVRILFGRNGPASSLGLVERAVNEAQDGIFRALCLAFLPRRLGDLLNRQSVGIQRRLRSAVREDLTSCRGGCDGMASLWQDARAEDGTLLYSDDEVVEHCINMLFAGAETTAATMPWVLYNLVQHAEALRGVEEEILLNLGTDSTVSAEALGQLRHTRNVVAETLRLNTPIWILTRRTTREIPFANGVIPAGAMIVLSPYAIQRLEKLHRNSKVFQPSRWDGVKQSVGNFEGLWTFGGGPRRCIGDSFAVSALVLMTAEIVKAWRLTSVAPPESRIRATSRPTAMLMRLQSRSASPRDDSKVRPFVDHVN